MKTTSIIGYICAILSLFLLPPILMIGGIICGAISISKSDNINGAVIIGLSVIFGVIGMAIGAACALV